MHWQTSSRVTNNSTLRSQTARPSRLTNGFLSRLSRKRLDLPAAGMMTAKRGMADLLRALLETINRARGSSYRTSRQFRQSLAKLRRLGLPVIQGLLRDGEQSLCLRRQFFAFIGGTQLGGGIESRLVQPL